MNGKCTVFFNGQFWMALLENWNSKGEYSTAQYLFGHEPGDAELLEFSKNRFSKIKLEITEPVDMQLGKKLNYKRQQREIRQIIEDKGHVTRAQQAMKAAWEENKGLAMHDKREEYRAKEEERFQRKQLKKKEKQRGH